MITIGFLADYLDTIPTLTKWFRAQWPDYFADMSQAEMAQDFLEDAGRDRLPIRLVAFEASELVGTIVLRENGSESLAEFQPELGGLYVVEAHRGHGVGTALVRAGMKLAADQGYETVFATTVAAAGILERLGWEFVKTVIHQDGPLALYRCKLWQTTNLELVPKTRDEVEAMIAAMSAAEKAQLSADWLARFRASTTPDPWVHGFSAVHRASGTVVGTGGFKGPPADGMVEIAYGVEAAHRSKGYATEIAAALLSYAFEFKEVEVVRAHTLPEATASKRVLMKCGFEYVAEVIDPEDGLVWRFEKRRV